jgi:hypothetical protein
MSWGEMCTKTVDGVVVNEAVGDFCKECLPVVASFPMPAEELVEQQDSEELSAHVNESRARSSGHMAPIAEKESVDKTDKFVFQGGRHVILLTEGELASLAGRTTVTKGATEGVPTVCMRKEGEPGEWEDVFLFPDPDKPGRRGFIGQTQEVAHCSNSMNMTQHTWDGQGEAFYNKAISYFNQDVGALCAVKKKSNEVRSLQDVIEKLRKPSDPSEDARTGQGGTDAKRMSADSGSPLGERSSAGSAKSSGITKQVLSLFTSPRGKATARQPSPRQDRPSKASRSDAPEAPAPGSPQSPGADEPLAAPGSPGARSLVSTTSTSAFDILMQDNDSAEEFLKKWKKTCPEELVLLDQVDGRSVEGLTRANRRLQSLANRDPLKQEAADKFNVFHTRVKHAQLHSISKIVSMSKAEVDVALQKLQSSDITIPAQYNLTLLSMAVKRDLQEKRHMQVLFRSLPLSNGKVFNPLDIFLGAIDCPPDDKVVLFKTLSAKMVFGPLIRGGKENAETVNQACWYILDNFSKVDVITADSCIISCKTEAERCARFLHVLYSGSIDPRFVEDVLEVGSIAGQEKEDESLPCVVSNAVAQTDWWLERYSQYKRVTRYTEDHGEEICDLAHRVKGIGDNDKVSDDDLKVLAHASKLMSNLHTKLPIDNAESSFLHGAIPPLLKKAFCKLSAEHQQAGLKDESEFSQLQLSLQAARDAFPDSQDVLWVDQHVEELRNEVMAQGHFKALQTEGQRLLDGGLDTASSEQLAVFDDLIHPCLACDFDDNGQAKTFLSNMMESLIGAAFRPSSDSAKYIVKGHLITSASKLLPVCRKSGALHLDSLIDVVKAIKSLSEVLKDEDQKDPQALYEAAQKDKFALCKNLTAEMKKMQAAKAIADTANPSIMSKIAHVPLAFTDAESRSKGIISHVYGLRKASLEAELTAAHDALSKMVEFGDGKDAWNAGLAQDAKQDAVYSKAAKTCMTVVVDDLIKATSRLSQARLDL